MDKGSNSLDNIERIIKDYVKLKDKAKSIIDLENKFINGVTNVSSVLYSPVKNWGKSESKNGIKYFTNLTETLDLEVEIFKNIAKKMSDPKINIALFGDVSAGKSQTINAILGRRLFIPVYCNGTICFVKISLQTPSKDNETIEAPNQEVKECTSEDDMRMRVKDFANYNGTVKLKPDEILRINVKKREKDVIMRENVTLIDCPGGNDSVDVAKRIKEVVKEADLFLFIFNQVLFDQQRIFFHELLKVTSPPYIFVLINKWDETDYDDPIDVQRVRDSTKAEIEAWLREVDSDYNGECGERIFFVSANETLQSKTDSPTIVVSDNQIGRLKEFAKFERILGEFLGNDKEIKSMKNNKEVKTRLGELINEYNGKISEIVEKKKKCWELIKSKMEDVNKCRGELLHGMEQKIMERDYGDIDYCYGQLLKEIKTSLDTFTEDLGWTEMIWRSGANIIAVSTKYIGETIHSGKGFHNNSTKHKENKIVDDESDNHSKVIVVTESRECETPNNIMNAVVNSIWYIGGLVLSQNVKENNANSNDDDKAITEEIPNYKEDLVKQMHSFINNEVEAILGPLQDELSYYEGYISEMYNYTSGQ